jgi:lipopolysaccharide/colanic/teichoic acid biosynthesis glycosyltransferase
MDTHGGEPPSFRAFNEAKRPEVPTRPNGVYVRVVKPGLDRVLGLFLLILFSPVIILAGLFVLVTLGRPVFYSQERIGLDGEPFRLYKLRTMIPDRRAQQVDYHSLERRFTHKSPTDPRVNRVGKVIRAMRLDELPQFWNVVKGDMSLVGPRPELPEIVRRYEPWQHQRHMVKPGVTGPWQISPRNGHLMHECTQIDLEYLARVSLLQDLGILARTPMSMLGNRKGF